MSVTWRPIETAPKDGTRFWGNEGDNAIAMFWHEGFGEYVSSFRRVDVASGYTIDDKDYKDHTPHIHKPSHWMPLPAQAGAKSCEHKNREVGYDANLCLDCGSIHTDMQWGIASDKWFKNRLEAQFYQKNGRLPDPIP